MLSSLQLMQLERYCGGGFPECTRRVKHFQAKRGNPWRAYGIDSSPRPKDRAFLKAGGVFDDDFIDSYIELKMSEVTRFEMTPHPVEFDMYYSG